MADQGKYVLAFFPQEQIELREEIKYHPDLMVILATQPDKDFYIQLSEIAAYCGILLNGTYSGEDIKKLCELLLKDLQQRRYIYVDSPARIQ